MIVDFLQQAPGQTLPSACLHRVAAGIVSMRSYVILVQSQHRSALCDRDLEGGADQKVRKSEGRGLFASLASAAADKAKRLSRVKTTTPKVLAGSQREAAVTPAPQLSAAAAAPVPAWVSGQGSAQVVGMQQTSTSASVQVTHA